MASRLSIVSGGTSGSSGATIFTVSPTISAGQSMIMTVHGGTNLDTVNSVSQTNCTWTKAVSVNALNDGNTEIWYCIAAGASPGGTVTVNMGVTAVAGGVIGVYDTALISATPLDKTASSTGNADPSVTGTTASTTYANEVWVGALTVPDPTNVGFGYGAASNGFIKAKEGDFSGIAAGNTHYLYLEKFVLSTGAANSSASLGVSNAYSGAIATFEFPYVAEMMLMGVGRL